MVAALLRWQERGGEDVYQDDANTVKWTMDNELDLIVIAIYQRGLVLAYVDELLTACKQQFAQYLSKVPEAEWDGVFPCDDFTGTFRKLQQDVEKRAVEAKLAAKKPRSFTESKKFQNTRQGVHTAPAAAAAAQLQAQLQLQLPARRPAPWGAVSPDRSKGAVPCAG